MIPFILGMTIGIAVTVLYTGAKINKIISSFDKLKEASIVLEEKGTEYINHYKHTGSEYSEGKAYGICEALEIMSNALD